MEKITNFDVDIGSGETHHCKMCSSELSLFYKILFIDCMLFSPPITHHSTACFPYFILSILTSRIVLYKLVLNIIFRRGPETRKVA